MYCANSFCGSLVSLFANNPLAPCPINAGVLGIQRTSAAGFSNQSSSCATFTPAATETNSLDESKALYCVKHDYTPKSKTKFLNQPQSAYPKKNWSSFMLMNCKKCTQLTPNYVNRATGLELHQFKWLEKDNLIGELPLEWNWLAGEYEYKNDVKNVHFTEGGPWFTEYEDGDYSNDWFKYYGETTHIDME